LFYHPAMVSGALLREARRRAGLSQAELGHRVGRPQTQIARWERGAVLPSLETLRQLVRACGLELTMGLAASDDSYALDAAERLALTPALRLARAVASANAARKLRAHSRRGDRFQPFAPLPVLATLEAADVRFVLVGTLAGALRGSPLLPVDATLALVPAADAPNLVRLEAALAEMGGARSDADDVWLLPKLGGEIAIVLRPPGTSGYSDLRRDATSVAVGGGVHVLVASLLDLVRIVEASPEPEQHAQVVALRATLELVQTNDARRLVAGV